MAAKNTARVIIGGKIFTLGGYETEEYFQSVASYMNSKIDEMTTLTGYSRLPEQTRQLMLSLNIADDYFKARKQVEMLEADLQQKDQEMYDLKHELIALQLKVQESQKKETEAINNATRMEEKLHSLEKEMEDLLQA